MDIDNQANIQAALEQNRHRIETFRANRHNTRSVTRNCKLKTALNEEYQGLMVITMLKELYVYIAQDIWHENHHIGTSTNIGRGLHYCETRCFWLGEHGRITLDWRRSRRRLVSWHIKPRVLDESIHLVHITPHTYRGIWRWTCYVVLWIVLLT